MSRPVQLGIVGDVHLAFSPRDVGVLDAAGYDAILFVGDLSGYGERGGLEVARVIATLRTPTFVIPGNHDAAHVSQLAAEVLESDRAVEALERVPALRSQEQRVEALARALAGHGGRGAILGGFSRHRIEPDGAAPIDLVIGRPHSFGGPRLAFRPYLSRAFDVTDLAASADRLDALLGACTAERVIVLAHNGPAGLGAKRDDMFGCDFRASEGDFGDPDLREAIDRARARGQAIAAVVAGHMHHHVRGGGKRPMTREVDGTLYVNAARVPRVIQRDGRTLRHHVRLTLQADGTAAAHEVLASDDPRGA